MPARDDDPAIWRFLSVDTVQFADAGAGHFNRYAYVTNDLLNATYPTGEFAHLIAAAGAAVGGALVDAAIQVAQGEGSFSERLSNVDVGQSVRTGLVSGATVALGPAGATAALALTGAAGAGEAILDARQDGASAGETAVRAVVGAGSAVAASRVPGVRRVSENFASGTAVREMLGQVPPGSAEGLTNAIEAGIGTIAGSAISEVTSEATDAAANGLAGVAQSAGDTLEGAFGCGSGGDSFSCGGSVPR